ncbi:Zn-dependent oxidoreductase [Citrobacter rodentium]|jgi:Threonine dehydrogenase and related Zn-dependent dehydrogenases|uniref:Dehydrogenase n=2 Tax=Citrobacter rodentium TaxID=67825 RepID=D2TP70_CITRI|nr:Zn-dependent oxidoreductase [Citrobacter rodentium]KIQ50177.1 oxidoreductase [Citrobacter rodentium]QBY30868.1 Zn-dependent oxidoreductase [Citrobacter rodentium]UHO31766.1 Zn-dependent oxidoreductase [Citrobacter rodentium NBRC 105723 = DSM 16636]CBG91303.1 putative dehydrogenase [Citrobacter rodentium ICC168]HAT8012206.1 Zn-dependent oxidoreductase [Citrobacter rodentium NBRC 105723 = DSM 16636]
MRSVVVEKPGQLTIAQRPVPEPGAHEVRVKVVFAGICGSDVHIYHGHNPFAKYPRVIGHEFFGLIDAVGEGVDGARLGQRVSVDPVVSCGHCYPCSVGRPNVCSQLQVIGVHRDGGFSDYVCVPAKNAYPIPENISDRQATMVEPFTIAANITAQMKPTPQDIALVYGAGPMGLTAIQALKGVYGVSQVVVADRIPERLEMAKNNGADLLINNAHQPLAERLAQEKIAPTLVIDAACHPAILQEAINLASPAARIGILGFSADPSTVTQQSITSKEISIFSSRLNSARFPMVIEWMEKGQINPDALITHCMPLEQVKEAMDVFAHDQQTCCKVLLQLDK